MKILVCISHVPDTTSKISFIDGSKELQKKDIQFIINPYDELALTRALELKEQFGGVTVTVVHVGTAETELTLRKALAIGADNAIRVDVEPENGFFVAMQLAEVARLEDYSMIFTGKESIDYNGGQVGEMLAELLDWPSISSVSSFSLNGDIGLFQREIDGGKEQLSCQVPFLVTAQKGFADEPRIPNMRGIMNAKRKRLDVLAPIKSENLTEVVTYELPEEKTKCHMISSENPSELIRFLRQEAKVI